jgi:signal transduction histidine kinase
LLILRINLSFRPIVAIAVNAVLTIGLVLISVLVWDNLDIYWFWHWIYFAVVSCLFWQVNVEARTRQSSEEATRQLRLNSKNLLSNNRQIISSQEQALEQTRQKERNRMARGIHDTLGHTLTAILVQLSAALQLLPAELVDAREKITNARTEAKNGLANVRRTIENLDEQGQSFAEKVLALIQSAQAGLSVRILSLIDPDLALTAQQEAIVLSSLQEGLTNGVRHGDATNFVFRLEQNGNHCQFYLEDNGRGAPITKRGYGLTAMEASVGQLGGTFEAVNHPEQGFILRLTWPVKNEAVSDAQLIGLSNQNQASHQEVNDHDAIAAGR